MRKRIIPDELARQNWWALCDLAQVVPDTTRTAEELVERLRRFGRAFWSVEQVQRAIDEYEATL
jgi:hypothetical protein